MAIHRISKRLTLKGIQVMVLTGGIVLLKFKPEVLPEQRQLLWDDAAALSSKIPAVQSLVIGNPVFSPLGHSYDAGAAFLFDHGLWPGAINEIVLRGYFPIRERREV
jgi:hypothetical protein